ncbi:MAG: polyphenol oxidase family protein [bacterium]|nr:polyphenol oxidase family protein [bacterium]
MTVLRSTLLGQAGFEHGFGTRLTVREDYPGDVHILVQVHGERVVVLTGNQDTETRRRGDTGKRTSSIGSIPPSPAHPLAPSVSPSPSPPHPLTHSNAEVVYQNLPSHHFRFDEGDAMVTDIPGTAVGIRTADCLPILTGDTATGAVAAIHCGWRSLASGLAAKGVRALITLTGSGPDSLVAALGPSIGPCCCEVGEEVRSSFPSDKREGLFEIRGGSLYLDLAAGAKSQLLTAGMAADSIEEITGCTLCDRELLLSFRGGDEEERMVSFIRAAGN